MARLYQKLGIARAEGLVLYYEQSFWHVSAFFSCTITIESAWTVWQLIRMYMYDFGVLSLPNDRYIHMYGGCCASHFPASLFNPPILFTHSFFTGRNLLDGQHNRA